MPATSPPLVNRQILLLNRPTGAPAESDFRMVETPAPVPKEGEVLVQALYLSLDPYMRGRMSERASYARPVALGEVMTGGVVGRVVASRNAAFRQGDIVEGILGWQDYALSNGKGLRKIDPRLAPISTALRRPRHAGAYRLFRPPRARQAQARRDGGGLRRLGCGRRHRRPDRQDHGL